VACLDEVGRGCLAGPVMAAAVCANLKFASLYLNFKLARRIKDSKKLTPKKREEFYKILTKNSNIKWGLGRVSEKVIDKINILEATKLAMEKAVKNLNCKIDHPSRAEAKRTTFSSSPSLLLRKSSVGEDERKFIDQLILDGNMKINLPIPQKSIVKADEKVFSVALASIIAKVTRDRLMSKYAKKFPAYGFEKHKGYATKLHLAKLKKHGPCKIHRKSFRPIKTCKLK